MDVGFKSNQIINVCILNGESSGVCDKVEHDEPKTVPMYSQNPK